MTIVAGFVLLDGILLCADTLYTDGLTKRHRDKIFTVYLNHATVSFAIAGCGGTARMAFDECKEALEKGKHPRSTASISRTVKAITSRIWRDYVIATPFEEREDMKFYLMVAIATKDHPPVLLASGPTGILERVDEFECIGSGKYLGQAIITAGYRRDLKVNDAAILAIQALALAKKHVDGCGGKSQFLCIRGSLVSGVVPYDVSTAEDSILLYEGMVSLLLLAIGSATKSDAQFRKTVDNFRVNVEDMRKSWSKNGAPYRELLDSLSTSATQ